MSETTDAAAEAGTADDALRDDAAINTAIETQDEGEPTEAAAAEPEEIEEIELSFGAEKLKVGKNAIPEDVLAKLESFTKNVQGDYTRKTQEVAEQRKAAEAQLEFVQKLATLKGDTLKAFSDGQRIAAEIQHLESLNLEDVWQSNPDQARRISDALSAKRMEFQRHVSTVSQHEAAMDAEQQRHVASQLEQGKAKMRQLVKDFDDKAEAELIQYAVKAGIPEQDVQRWALNPTTAAFAHKAMLYDRLQAQTKAATAAKPPAAPVAPVRPVAGKPSPSARNLETMSGDEYMRVRNAEIARRNRR